MSAAAFTQTAIMKGANGRTFSLYMTVSDVNGEYAVCPDGSSTIQLPSDQPYYLADLIVVTGGTDTTTQTLFVNNTNSGITVVNKANLSTSYHRQFMSAPLGFKPGSMLKFKQNT